MKFKNEKMELGMRFYTFISDDEYKLVTLVKINKDNNSGQFMDEETFEIETISKETLDEKYTLLTDYETWILCKFKVKKEFENEDDSLWVYNKNESIWLYNDDVSSFIKNQVISYPYYVKIKLRLVVYKFMKKSVFNKLINYIINLHYPKFSLSESDNDIIWEEYFRLMNKYELILNCSDKANLDMDAVINNNAKIPDDIINEAEEILNTFILTYDPYELDDSVNMNNVNMKHFLIYINDKYYLILYVIDTQRENIAIQENLKENMDIVNFMLK